MVNELSVKEAKPMREVPRPDFSMFQKLPSGSLHEAAGVDSSEKIKTAMLKNLASTHDDVGLSAYGVNKLTEKKAEEEVGQKTKATISGGIGAAVAGAGHTGYKYHATLRSATNSLSSRSRGIGDVSKNFYHYAQNLNDTGDSHIGVGGKYRPELFSKLLDMPQGDGRPYNLADGPKHMKYTPNVGEDFVSPFSGEFRITAIPNERDRAGRLSPIITAGKVDKTLTKKQFSDKAVSETMGFATGIKMTISEAELQRLHHHAGKIYDAHSTKNALKSVLGKNTLAAVGIGGALGVAGYYAANSLHKKAEEQPPAKKVREVPRPDFSLFQKLPSGSLHEAAGVDSSEKLKTNILRNLAYNHEDPMVRARAKLVLDVAKWRRYKQRQQNNAV